MGEANFYYFTCLKFKRKDRKNLLKKGAKMYSTSAKIAKPAGEKPDEFEQSISQTLLELEMNSDLKQQLRELHVTAAKEVDVGSGKRAIVIFVPVPQLKAYQKIQTRLVRELEKKFNGRHVVFIAQRRILPKPTKKSRNKQKQKRPRNRTLTSVHSAILDDKAQQTQVEHKVDTSTSNSPRFWSKNPNKRGIPTNN